MNQILKELNKELSRINDYIEKKAFSPEDIADEEKNFARFIETQSKLAELLIKITKNKLDHENQFCEDIMDLHVLTNNLAWYFENLNENVQKLIKCYPFSKDFLEKNSL